MVCDAYIVQQPLITQIYINGLFQTNNNTYSVLTTHRFILIPINSFSYSVHTIDCQEGKYWYVHSCNTILSTFVQYNTHISSVHISGWRVNDCTVECENVLQDMKRDVCLHKLVFYVNIIAQLYMVLYND